MPYRVITGWALLTLAVFAARPASAAGARVLPGQAAGAAEIETAGGIERLALPDGARLGAAAALGDGWIAAGSEPTATGGRALYLVERRAGVLREPSPPPGQSGRYQTSPALLVRDGELAGIAWLEGDGVRAFAVRAATRDGDGWRPGPWVSQPGPGSQLALAGTVLADGRWLLVWSSFDGEDNEIHYALGDGERWSEPARLHADNAVPDITPALVATPGGALVAWCRYDGNDYRLRLARWSGGSWRELGWHGGRGSLEPGFEPGLEPGDGPLLLYRTVAGETWDAAELGPDGAVRATAAVPGGTGERPVLRRRGSRLLFVWADGGELSAEWSPP